MGQGYIIECPKCQYRSKDIMMGVGFLFGSVENILETLTGHDQEQVQRLLNQKQWLVWGKWLAGQELL